MVMGVWFDWLVFERVGEGFDGRFWMFYEGVV